MNKHTKRNLLIKLAFIIASIMQPMQIKAADIDASSRKITVVADKISLTQLFSQIEKQTDFLFFYVNADVQNIYVRVQARNKSINDVLNEALKGTGLIYKIKNRYINIYRNKNNEPERSQQTRRITGRITDENGETIVGANIIEEGTNKGTISDINGRFSMNLEDNPVIQVSFTGFAPLSINTKGKSELLIVLKENSK